jgi:hypothetical protein
MALANEFDAEADEPDEWELFQGEVDELDEAARLLVRDGSAEAAALVEFHRAKDHYVDTCAQSTANAAARPDNLAWGDMICFSQLMLDRSPERRLWRGFGAEVADAEQKERTTIEFFRAAPPWVGVLRKQVTQLTRAGRNGFLSEVMLPLAENGSAWQTYLRLPKRQQTYNAQLRLGAYPWHDMITWLDSDVRAALQGGPEEPPVLVLNQDSITFYGERRELTDFDRRQIRCLWVLAEHAGRPVARSTIIKEGGLTTSLDGLKVIVSDLRKHVLRRLAEDARKRSARIIPQPELKKRFVGGGRKDPSGRAGGGPYRLELAASAVRVDRLRPDWMTPRAR